MVKKGVAYTVEAFLAASLVLVTLMLVYTRVPSLPKFSLISLQEKTYNCLEEMDLRKKLREEVKETNTSSVEGYLEGCTPPAVNLEVKICTPSSCTALHLPGNETVTTTTYFVAGKGKDYFPSKVVVFTWKE